jgi:hypothetical protein
MGLAFTVRQPNAFVAGRLRQTGLYDDLMVDR